MQAVAQDRRLDHLTYAPIRIPARKLEVGFYIAVFYSLTSDVWGISVPLGAGALFLGIAWLRLRELRSCAKAVYAPVGLLLASAITYMLIQVLVHGESITGDTALPFVVWILQLLIVHSLCLRSGFSYRYPLILFLVAVSSLPYLTVTPGEIERAKVEASGLGGGLSNANILGEWFGFFAIYFAICGLETTRFMYRSGAWALALGCLFVVGLSVSRGSILGAALGR